MLTPEADQSAPEDELEFGPEHRVFRDTVRQFLASCLPERLREGSRATPTVFAEPEISREWQRTLYEKGWLAYNWPQEFGGTGWPAAERYIFEKECALAACRSAPWKGAVF